jgi:putative heme-binding domain-containing protein
MKHVIISLLLLTLCITELSADSVAKPSADNSVEAELASFKMMEGYTVNLFASEDDGIINPIAIRWDSAGRLWVLSTMAYAQVEPGVRTHDRLLILEDTNGDGRSDVTHVWADDLNMPTGFALTRDGVYIGEGTNLVFLKDSDGDGKADTREIVLSGFGTDDTHQNINSLSWGPAGDLWFSQGLHNESRVETPWGIVRGEKAGFYRLRPKELKLEPFCMPSMASQNPWGINFGHWGEVFVKGNSHRLSYITPGLIPTQHFINLMDLAKVADTPGKSMNVEFIETSHMPGLKYHVAIAGYYANRVTVYPLQEDKSGFAQTVGKELILSTHPSFRPVETLVGPDGAMYVADWFNPIIGHYQASLRHPDRDKSHGRIWRISSTSQPLVKTPDLTKASTKQLVSYLSSPERWVRYQAKRLLSTGETTDVMAAIAEIKPQDEHHLYEMAGVCEAHEQVDVALIERFLAAKEPRLRAYGTRMIGRWQDKLDDPLELIARSIEDNHPRVRLEAVVAASHLDSADAMRIALHALNKEMDRFIDFSLTQCAHALSNRWMPAIQAPGFEFDSSQHLAYAVGAIGGSEAAGIIRPRLASANEQERRQLLQLLAKVGDAESLAYALKALPTDLPLLKTLQEASISRRIKPAGNIAKLLEPALQSSDQEVAKAAVVLAGNWRVEALKKQLLGLAENDKTNSELRNVSLLAVARLMGEGSAELLIAVGTHSKDSSTRLAAVEALTEVNLKSAAVLSSQLLANCSSPEEANTLVAPYLSRRGGVELLAAALKKAKLTESAASYLSQALARIGRNDSELIEVINGAMGIRMGASVYSPELVEALAAEVRADGNQAHGKQLYESPALSCIACHSVKGQGGVIGPDISTVGSGLPLELIIESVLWPERQIKEGYVSMNVSTRSGRVYNGYREKEEAGILWIRDIATREVVPIQTDDVRESNETGTLMPAGLTAGLSREELRDLIRYLYELRG